MAIPALGAGRAGRQVPCRGRELRPVITTGAELLGEVSQYESIFLLCYLRGPAGIIVALAEQIS